MNVGRGSGPDQTGSVGGPKETQGAGAAEQLKQVTLPKSLGPSGTSKLSKNTMPNQPHNFHPELAATAQALALASALASSIEKKS